MPMRETTTRAQIAVPAHDSRDMAVIRARETENVVVGQEIIRHRFTSRVIHWSVAVFMLLSLLTGLPIWTPIFGWMAPLFGGLSVCRWLHPWTGVLFAASSLVMFVHWLKEMHLEPNERDWLGPKLLQYLKYQSEDSEVGKYNGGQKLFFFAASLGALGLLAFWSGATRGLLDSPRCDIHSLHSGDRGAHLPRHCGGAGHFQRDDPRHGE